ncbi:restriction endonuclease subunit S [Streptomyces klenkii]|uniref:restriction endonuclease subunit S n=1 Tax=Streptomyces klenkii TaxID=1420899 RepID=UPI003F4D071B
MGKQLSPSSRSAGEQYPYLRVANVLDGYIDYSDVKTMGFSSAEREVYGLAPGDVLLNEGQSLELVGRSAIYDGAAREFCFQNTLVRFRPGSKVLSKYAQAVFKWWLTAGVFAEIAKKTTSIAHLGGDRFARLPFPLIPLERQRYIVEALDAVTESERVAQAAIVKLRAIESGALPSLMALQRVGDPQSVDRDYVACREIFSLTGGFPLSKARPNSAGKYPIYGSSGFAGRGDRVLTGRPTIVIGRVGEGGVGSVRYVAEPAWVTDNALWVECIEAGWDPEFVAIYLSWCDLRKLRSQTGQPLITQGAIANVRIPRMSLEEQGRVIQVAQAWGEQRILQENELAKLRILKQALADDLLSGNVRVNKSA